jgi:hypothetical protein
MPVNFTNVAIADAKLGVVDISKAYIGHEQVYPNDAFISGLTFTVSSINNGAQSVNFTVTGTEGAQYTLTGSVGATAPSGTQTLPAGGSNTHSISIGAQSTGAAIRYPRVTVATVSSSTPTSFSPTNLQTYDTVEQAAGPAPSYNHTMNYSVTGNGSTHSSTSVNSAGTVLGAVSSNSYPLTAGATWYSTTVYVFPSLGYEFDSASDVTCTPTYTSGQPTGWISGTNSPTLVTDSTKSYISFTLSPTGQSQAVSATLTFACSATQITTTWTYDMVANNVPGTGIFLSNSGAILTGGFSYSGSSGSGTGSCVMNDQGSGYTYTAGSFTKYTGGAGRDDVNSVTVNQSSGVVNGTTVIYTANVSNIRRVSRTFGSTLPAGYLNFTGS